jgi:hypothetical protein
MDNFPRVRTNSAGLPKLTQMVSLDFEQAGFHCRGAELWSAAKSTLNMDLIQATVLQSNLDVIERIESLVATAQQRFDEVIRELDRHRIIQNQLNSPQNIERPKFEAAQPKLIAAKPANKKVA